MNQLATTQSNGLAAPQSMSSGFTQSDIIIPKIMLMQGQSDMVKQRQAMDGDIVKSTTGEKLGDHANPFHIVALATPQKLWIKGVKRPGDKKYRYAGVEERNASNEGLPWYYVGDERGNDKPSDVYECQRVMALDVYALLLKDLENEEAELAKADELPDLSRLVSPFAIRFKSSSLNAGKAIYTHFAKALSVKQAPWHYSLQLGCAMQKNDDGTYYVFNVNPQASPINKKYWAKIDEWASMLNSKNVQVQEEDNYTAEF